MIYLDRLRAAMVEAGYASVAKAGESIGIKSTTMYAKMKDGEFTSSEMDLMIDRWNIRHPEEIFVFRRSI